MSLLHLVYVPVRDLNFFFKICIKVYGSLYFPQFSSSRWMDDSQRNLFNYLYVKHPRIVWFYTTLLLIQKRKFTFLFLKITSWFLPFLPPPSLFFKNFWKDHECWGIVQVHCLWVPSQVFVFIYNSWFLQKWLTFVAFDDENLWM